MKKIICIICLSIALLQGYAQNVFIPGKHDYNWIYFGYYTLYPFKILNFENEQLNIINTNTQYYLTLIGGNATANTMNTADGEIQIATDNIRVVDNYGYLIIDSLNIIERNDPPFTHLNQYNIILPFKNKSVIIHKGSGEVYVDGMGNDYIKRMFYTEVFYDTDNTTVTDFTKNNILLENYPQYTDGTIHACRHANGRDWWVIVRKHKSNEYKKLLVTPDSIYITTGNANFTNYWGDFCKAKFSPDGTKYAYMHSRGMEYNSFIHIFNFDRCTGDITYDKSYPYLHKSNWEYAIEWSPNSKYLYYNAGTYINQVNIETNVIDTIARHDYYYQQFFVSNPPTDTFFQYCLFDAMQLAPDGKIYIGNCRFCNNLAYINKPNEAGQACDFRRAEILLNDSYTDGMANNPNYRLGPIDGSPCDTLGIDNAPYTSIANVHVQNSIRLYPNPAYNTINVSAHSNIKAIHILDSKGAVLSNLKTNNEWQYSLNTDKLNNGMYTVKVITQTETLLLPLIIQH